MRKIYTMVLALMVLLSVTMSAAALETKIISRQNGESATASWSDATAGSFTDLFVTKTNDGIDIFVIISTPTSFKLGFILTQENVFDIDNKLTTATLSPVTLDLFDFNTGTTETVTIQAQWTGSGDLTKNSFKFMSKSGEFISKFSDKSAFRQATAIGSIGDIVLGTSNFANLIEFKDVSMTLEK